MKNPIPSSSQVVIQIQYGMFDYFFSKTAASSHGNGIFISPLALLLYLSTLPAFSRAQTSIPDPTNNSFGYHGGINSTMTAVIVVLVCAFFFIGLFAVYFRQCTARRPAAIPVNPRISAEGGLDPELIDTFPIIVYSEVKYLKIGKVPLECAVCLNEFQDDESLRLLPKCDHVFHPDCIDEWLATNITCPVCRTDLATETDEEEIALNSEQVVPVSNGSPSEKTPPKSELISSSKAKGRETQVSIDVPDDPTVEIAQTSQTLKQNRPPRSRSTRTGNFPRSHSTGHSLVQPGASLERFTLRLPEEVKNQIAMKSMMNRTRSTGGVVFPRAGSARTTGFRSGSERSGKVSNFLARGSGRFDRWEFLMAPPFLSRVGSVRSTKEMTAKVDGAEHSSARPHV